MTGAASMLWVWLASLAIIALAVVADLAWTAGYERGKADAKAAARRAALGRGLLGPTPSSPLWRWADPSPPPIRSERND